ncbi:hypothetical protein [Thalassotalea euphylliae]|uniref:Lipoprotein n=1 Tax=Thalassotalea euphylliae TaxID=1655234 RepID=A0A3E0UDZ3_9GAMM|nr:hypothetical protein [Thalassotalea euphylliae]REL35251.1 hypothetical protein DXX92_07705 [Thalassotalea euphylliae]
MINRSISSPSITAAKRYVLALGITLVTLLSACSSPIANRTPINETFPTVTGENLNQEQVLMPRDLSGEHRLLLIGYVQDSQFDIDRWLIGLDMTQTPVTAYELPTIKGMLPRMFETLINNGMRKGIPKQLWGGVITVYQEAEKITQLTGTENPNNARVILLGRKNEILYFYDRGFAVDALNDLRDVLAKNEQTARQ